MMSLEETMAKAQAGDKRAYAQLLQDIVPLIHSFLRQRLSDSDEIQDIAQEILISVHKAAATYDASRAFKPWLYAIARYRLNDHLRCVYKKNANAAEVAFDESTANVANALDITDRYDNIDYLSKALAQLSSKQRKIFVMLRIDGYSIRETSIATGMSESAVKVTMHRAAKKLSSHYISNT